MITLRAIVYAADEATDVTKFLPLDAFHIEADVNAAA